jgi:hypothetical protein
VTSDSNLAGVDRLYAINAPIGIKVLARVTFRAKNTGANVAYTIRSPDITSVPAFDNLRSASANVLGQSEFLVRTNTASQVLLNGPPNSTIDLGCSGWIDFI